MAAAVAALKGADIGLNDINPAPAVADDDADSKDSADTDLVGVYPRVAALAAL
jgi:hypothetical protein